MLTVLQLMVDSISVLKTAPSVSAPCGKPPWAVFPKWGRPAILLVQPMTRWVWQACSLGMWMVREVTAGPILTCSLCHGAEHVNLMP